VRLFLWLATTTTALGLAVLPGCSSEPPPPPTFKVEGRVVRKDNQPYIGGGYIEFRNVANPQHLSVGRIGDDGTFTLKTIAGNRSVAGAQAGAHTVTITPAGDGQMMRAVQLKKRYSIRAGEANTIVVKLE
jgi:hypothetical protein